MIQFLLVLLGVVAVVAGARRSSVGVHTPLARGDYKAAGQALFTGLALVLVGTVAAITAMVGSVGGFVVGVVVGGGITAVAGRMRYREIQKRVAGG